MTNTHTDNPDLDSVINKYITRGSFAGSVNRMRHQMEQDALRALARERKANNTCTDSDRPIRLLLDMKYETLLLFFGAATNYTPEMLAKVIYESSQPTKSSGELEEIRKMVARYDSSKVTGIDSLAGKELIEGIASLLATQTTKLQAEARQLVSDLWSKEVVNAITDLDDTTYAKIRDAFQETLKKFAQLEREHKIGEDGE